MAVRLDDRLKISTLPDPCLARVKEMTLMRRPHGRRVEIMAQPRAPVKQPSP
jgi:hypothetical protein